MARLLKGFTEAPRPCSYLSNEVASLEYRLMLEVPPEEWETMLARGWRRFGAAYFRPACASCEECVSLRLPVARFHPSRGHRRVMRKNADLRIELGPVQLDDRRLRLYRAWHQDREDKRGWEPSPIDPEDYAAQFAFPHASAREITYYAPAADGAPPRLIGVGLCDETPSSWSAIYFYYDPSCRERSLGTYHILTLLALTRGQAKEHLYLGYRVNGCESLAYKARFRPHELLTGRPAGDATPIWTSCPDPIG